MVRTQSARLLVKVRTGGACCTAVPGLLHTLQLLTSGGSNCSNRACGRDLQRSIRASGCRSVQFTKKWLLHFARSGSMCPLIRHSQCFTATEAHRPNTQTSWRIFDEGSAWVSIMVSSLPKTSLQIQPSEVLWLSIPGVVTAPVMPFCLAGTQTWCRLPPRRAG